MRHRRSPAPPPADWPRSLRHLIEAARHECPHGQAQALRDLVALAFRKVPARGLFDPGIRGEADLYVSIEAVADTHLDLAAARTAWHDALDAAGLAFEQRDHIERSALQMRSVSDTAYFYAGLAFGLVAAHAFERS